MSRNLSKLAESSVRPVRVENEQVKRNRLGISECRTCATRAERLLADNGTLISSFFGHLQTTGTLILNAGIH